MPGIYIGNCFVNAEKYECRVSVINTTDKAIEITTPHVTIEEIEYDTTDKIHRVQTNKSRKSTIPRAERIWQLLRPGHLNSEEKQAIQRICEEYQDVFYDEGESLTCIPTVAHEINTRADAAPVNVRPYRSSEKHKLEVNRQIKKMLLFR